MDLFSEQDDVRESVKRNLYTGQTYNSLDNIAQFFSERGMPAPSGIARARDSRTTADTAAGAEPRVRRPSPIANGQTRRAAASRRRAFRHRRLRRSGAASETGATAPGGKASGRGYGRRCHVHHPKYGRGTVLRREGEGEDAKLTISFPGYGLKKIVEKYAGMKVEE